MKTTVEIYAGLGTLRECRWKGELEHLPRTGEQVALPDGTEGVYEVQYVRHRLDEARKRTIEIYVR